MQHRAIHSGRSETMHSTMCKSIALTAPAAHSSFSARARSARACLRVTRGLRCFGGRLEGGGGMGFMNPTVGPVQPGIQLGIDGCFRPTDDVAQLVGNQLELPMLSRVAAPAVVHPDMITGCRSYRAAVRLCFVLRQRKGMCLRTAAEHAGVHVPHMTDFVHADDAPGRRDMPAKYIAPFEQICGNTAISQWIAGGAGLTVGEEAAVIELQAGQDRRAA